MSNVILINKQNTVAEAINELRESDPEMLIAFTMKNGDFLITSSKINNVTMFIGAMERMKFYLLNDV